jgi:dCTP deaminase
MPDQVQEVERQMIISGEMIRQREIIFPFCNRTVEEGMTYGVGPAGYDVRVEFDDDERTQETWLHPGEFRLASTMERFSMPSDLMGIVHDKSTLARRGLAVQNTVIEPGWYGWLTLELTNHSTVPIHLKRGQPIAQIVFHMIAGVVHPYDGKYQNQKRGPVSPISQDL